MYFTGVHTHTHTLVPPVFHVLLQNRERLMETWGLTVIWRDLCSINVCFYDVIYEKIQDMVVWGVGYPLTAPVSFSVFPPDLRERKKSPPKWYFEVRLTQRAEILIASACVLPLQKAVSVGTKTCLLILKTELRWYVHSCSELLLIPTSLSAAHTLRGAPGPAMTAPLMSLHLDIQSFMSPVISTIYRRLQCAPHTWHVSLSHWSLLHHTVLYIAAGWHLNI